MSLKEPPARSESDLVAERYRFLLTASTMLSTAMDSSSAIEALGRAAVPALGEICMIDMVGMSGKLERTGWRASDIELTAQLGKAKPIFDEDHPALRAIQTGEPVFIPHCSDQQLRTVAADSSIHSMMVERGLRWCLSVPIVARCCLGALTLVSRDGTIEGKWAEMAPQIAEDLARRAALALDHAKLFESSRHMAITLQRSLMPAALPAVQGIELAARYHAGGEGAEVGGDFYDVFPTENDGWAAVIGDVCGKGAEAAALSALARHSIRAANVDLRKPRRILNFVNQLVIQGNYSDRFITIAYCRMRPEGECIRATVGLAGHPPPILIRADGSISAEGRSGTLIGVTTDPELTDQAVLFRPGDALVLYTDGVTEARGPLGRFGQKRLEATLAECRGMDAEQIAGHLEEVVLGFQTELSRDDTAILVIRVKPAGTS